MLKPNFSPCTILLLFLITTISFAQAQTEVPLPIEVQRQAGRFYVVAQPEISGFRVALYQDNGSLRAESDALTNSPLHWPVPELEQGVYLCVFWLRGQGRAEKQLARLEVRSIGMTLQAAEQYLKEVETPLGGMAEYVAAKRRAYERGVAAIPLFRAATKVLPAESAAYLFLVRAMHLKYDRFGTNVFGPPPLPPPAVNIARGIQPIAIHDGRMQKVKPESGKTIAGFTSLPPTPEEKQEMLSACQKAVAVAKTCPEKTESLRWLAAVQGELEQKNDQLATLQQIAQASCATNEIKAQSWYNIGVIGWQCTYNLTTCYANPKRLARQPFHYRKVANAADQRKVGACLQEGITAIEKALSLFPNYAEAWSYRSLLYREQQKITASPDEQRKMANVAEDAAKRAIELTQKQRQ